jgi:hypothetical protein
MDETSPYKLTINKQLLAFLDVLHDKTAHLTAMRMENLFVLLQTLFKITVLELDGQFKHLIKALKHRKLTS